MSKINGAYVKRELTELRPKGGDRLALLSGFVRVSFSFLKRGSNIDLALDCQNDFVRDYIASLMFEQFKIKPIVYSEMSGGMPAEKNSELVFADGKKLLVALSVIKDGEHIEFCGIDERFKKRSRLYARGVFLGCGSLSVPKAESAQTQKSGGYHFEFAFGSQDFANDFLGLLSEYNIYGHLTVRGDKSIVYVKYRDEVSDCLALIGAEKTVLKFNEAVAAFAVKGEIVRMVNCEVANLDRTLKAAGDIMQAIDIIQNKGGLEQLDKKLFEAAKARLADPEATLSQIADRLGISKSGLKHRFDRLSDIAKELSEGK